MNKQKFKEYWNLTAQLVNCSDAAARAEIFTENCDLINKEFVQVMKLAAQHLEKQKKYQSAKWLTHFATQLEIRILTWEKLNQQTAKLYTKTKYNQALTIAKKALAVAKSIWHNDCLTVANSIQNVGFLLEAQSKLREAEPYYRDTLAMKHKVYYGLDNADLANSFNNLGELLDEQGRLGEAEPYYREALAMRCRLNKGSDRSLDNPDAIKQEQQLVKAKAIS